MVPKYKCKECHHVWHEYDLDSETYGECPKGCENFDTEEIQCEVSLLDPQYMKATTL